MEKGENEIVKDSNFIQSLTDDVTSRVVVVWKLPALPSSESLKNVPPVLPPDFTILRENINSTAVKIRCHYQDLRSRLKILQDLISYPSHLRTPPGTNLVAGEIWFATYATAEHCRVKDFEGTEKLEKMKKNTQTLSTHFQTIMRTICQIGGQLKAIQMAGLSMENKLPILLQSIVDIVTYQPMTKEQERMQKDISVKSSEISEETLPTVAPSSSFAIIKFGGENSPGVVSKVILRNDVDEDEAEAEADGSIMDGDFSQADTLANRQNREIFLRTSHNRGWINFRKIPKIERETIISDIVEVGHSRCQRLREHMERLRRSLIYSKKCRCEHGEKLHLSILMDEWKRHITKLKNKYSTIFSSQDRLHLHQIVLDMQSTFLSIFKNIRWLHHAILELCDVTYLSSMYLLSEYKFKIRQCPRLKILSIQYTAEYASRRPIPLNFFMPNEDDSEIHDEDEDVQEALKKYRKSISTPPSRIFQGDTAFYSKYYPVIHRRNAVTIADLQLILLTKVSRAVRHSMANFDGPRFLQLDQRHQIWLSHTRDSIMSHGVSEKKNRQESMKRQH